MKNEFLLIWSISELPFSVYWERYLRIGWEEAHFELRSLFDIFVGSTEDAWTFVQVNPSYACYICWVDNPGKFGFDKNWFIYDQFSRLHGLQSPSARRKSLTDEPHILNDKVSIDWIQVPEALASAAVLIVVHLVVSFLSREVRV